MKKLNSFCFALLSLTGILAVTAKAFAVSDPIWKVTFQKNVHWVNVAPTGHVIASTDEGLVGLDPEAGNVLWKREDLRKLKQWPEKAYDSWLAEFVPFSPYAVVRPYSRAHKTFKQPNAPYYIALLNVATGEDLWSTETEGFKEHYGYFLLPEIGAMFVYAKDKDKKKTLFLLEIGTGKVMWQKRDFFKKRDPTKFVLFQADDHKKETIVGNQPPLFDTDSTMITVMNKKYMRRFNARTGELIWETEIKGDHAPGLRSGYAGCCWTTMERWSTSLAGTSVFMPCVRSQAFQSGKSRQN